MSIEDQPTQQIRRPGAPTPAPLPGPLNVARSQPPAPPADTAAGSTEVLSLDDLFERQETPTTQVPARPAEAPRVQPVATTPAHPVEAPRIGAVPVRSAEHRGDRKRLAGDAAAAWHGGLDRTRSWLSAGDNMLIVGTALAALLLLLAVALF
ncbi:MAG TPA: hypothetical protein VFH66_02555 [Mycobacteriales bacterium]|nr:hypothetical protein [Mycobacteriales bacterium]